MYLANRTIGRARAVLFFVLAQEPKEGAYELAASDMIGYPDKESVCDRYPAIDSRIACGVCDRVQHALFHVTAKVEAMARKELVRSFKRMS
jgi:hypothetical protein